MRVIVSYTPSAIENRKQMVRVRSRVVGDTFKKGNIISEIQDSSTPIGRKLPDYKAVPRQAMMK